MKLFLPLLLLAPLAAAQSDPLLPLDWAKISANAKERTEVTLDGATIRSIARLLALDKDRDGEELKKLLAGLEGVYVHSYEFAEEGQYPKAEVDAARERLRQANWSRVVQSLNNERNENTEIYLKNQTGAKDSSGLVVLCAEARELTVVHISGKIDPKDLDKVGDALDIPLPGEKSEN